MTPLELSDHLEITRLLYLYARAIDRKNYKALREVFTPNAVIHYNVERGTKLEFRELEGWLERALEAFPVTLHVMSNPLIELAGDEATSTTYLTATHVQTALDGRRVVTVLHGIYTDEHERTGVGWRIRHRRLDAVHVEGEFLPPGEARTIPRSPSPKRKEAD
jgi:hypothetical protein